MDQFYRLELQIGKEKLDYLKTKKVIIFGVGGVGGYVVESLARSGISNFTLIDADKIHITNINRQIIATLDNLNEPKVNAAKKRILSINNQAVVNTCNVFYDENTAGNFNLHDFDYVIDCIDSVKSKLLLIKSAKEAGVKNISAMGAGNKFDITKLEVSDISKTEYDPLSKVIRRELRKLGINHHKVVYSKEKPWVAVEGREIPSNAFVPPAMGLIIGQEVILDLLKEKE